MKNFNERGGGFRGGDRGGKPSFQNKSWGSDRGHDRDKQMFKATCSECGKPCEVPFRPTSGKPVFCSDCFNSKRDESDTRGARPDFASRAPKRDFNDRHAPRPDFARPDPLAPHKPTASFDDSKKQLSEISSKLDRLISAIEKLSPSVASKVVAPVVAPKKIEKVVAKVEVKKAPAKVAVKKEVAKKVAPKKKVVVKKKK